MEIIDYCYEKAKEVIRICCTSQGLFASGGKDGYNALWARDSIISFLGASLVQDKLFRTTFRKSLENLGSHQSFNGQIPNAVDLYSRRKPHVDYASIDSTLWYIIGHYIYRKRYNDHSLFRNQQKKIKLAFRWLEYQDVGEDGTLQQLPTTDWQDAFPHKYGRTIHTQALYYKVLLLLGKYNRAMRLSLVVNADADKKLWLKNFYVPYRWKNHVQFKEMGDWFDSLGNILAILFGLADRQKARKIISYLEKNKINRPFPLKAIYPPIRKGTKYWQDYFSASAAGEPHHYLNGGIWTYIGAFYVLALIKLNQLAKARKELELLAKANLQGNFPEWINPQTKEAHGRLQAWNAGVYILAYKSLQKEKVLI